MAITGLYYINVEDDVLWTAKDEQHGIVMDPMTHMNLHMTQGMKWSQGGELTGMTDGGDTFTQVEAASHFDEDIPVTTLAITTMPFVYRYGSNGRFRVTAADNKTGYIASGDSYVSYNKETTGVWDLVESTGSTDYIIYFIAKTNFDQIPYVKFIGTETYSSRTNARDALLTDITAMNLAGTPGAELELQFAYICKRDGTVEDAGSPTYNVYVDLRGIPVN